jgi:hypothetical protein
MQPGPFDIGQICLNGHVITWRAETRPELRKKYCDKCGEETITQCSSCNANIQGEHYVPGPLGEWGISPSSIPAFCPNCGKRYPWTEKRIQATRELVEELDVSTEKKRELVSDIGDLLKDSPRTELVAQRWKKVLSKLSEPLLGTAKELLINIASETAKRAMFG